MGECAAMWDEVEELSQAASDKKPAPAELEPVPISEADMNFIKETQATLMKAKEAANVDVETLRALESASQSAKKVTVSSERLKQSRRRSRRPSSRLGVHRRDARWSGRRGGSRGQVD